MAVIFDGAAVKGIETSLPSSYVTPPFSVSLWFNLTTNVSSNPDGWNILIGAYAAWSPWWSWLFHIWNYNGNNVLTWAVIDWTGVWVQFSMDNYIAINRWYHICGTCDYPLNSRAYVDGVLQSGSGSSSNTPTSANTKLTIGRDGNTFGGRHIGIIDDVRIYNKILSSSEVEIIYYSQGSDRFDNTVGHWFMNDGAPGTVASGSGIITDVSNTKNNGTPYNSPTFGESYIKPRSRALRSFC